MHTTHQDSKNALSIIDDGFGVQERPGNNFIIGAMMKFDDGAFIVSKTEPLPLGTVLVALDITTAWVKWWDSLPAEHRITQSGQFHPEREDLGDLDRTQWQSGKFGVVDPWKDTRYLHLIDPQSGRDYTFTTDSAGGRIAIGELKSAIRNVRTVRPGAVPVVKLSTGSFKSKRYGEVPRPAFEIVEYRGGVEQAPAQIADQTGEAPSIVPENWEAKGDALPADLSAKAAPKKKANSK
jgi:hypothetical protein